MPTGIPRTAGPSASAAAVFTATRRELTGGHPLLASAEIARDACRRSERSISLLGLAPPSVRRIDGWLGPGGLVTHPAAGDDRPRVGSVCDRARATEMIAAIGTALVGPLPGAAAVECIDVSSVGALSASTLPVPTRWFLIVSTAARRGDALVDRLAIADADGLVGGRVASLDSPVLLCPMSTGELTRRLDVLVGRAPRTVAELLARP